MVIPRRFGSKQPRIGAGETNHAIFGVVIDALLESKLLNVAPPGSLPLALPTVMAFLAGFNERLAQDALISSVNAVPSRVTGAAP